MTCHFSSPDWTMRSSLLACLPLTVLSVTSFQSLTWTVSPTESWDEPFALSLTRWFPLRLRILAACPVSRVPMQFGSHTGGQVLPKNLETLIYLKANYRLLWTVTVGTAGQS